jgi:hypothetical protein
MFSCFGNQDCWLPCPVAEYTPPSTGGTAVDVPVLATQAEMSDVLDAVFVCLFLGFLRMEMHSQAMSNMAIIAPKPAPTPMPILAARDRPPLCSTPFLSGNDRAKISSVMMCTETVGLAAVAVEAITALREEIWSVAAAGMGRL